MGIILEYVSLAEVPPMALVKARVTEMLHRPVELVEHVLEVRELVLDSDDPRYEHPAYLLLCRALTELGGKQAPVELLARKRFRQRFEFEGSAPAPLEIHEQILRLGGCDIAPPRAYPPWFELFTAAPDSQCVTMDPQPPWLHMIAGHDCRELFGAVYDVLLSFGAKPRPDW